MNEPEVHGAELPGPPLPPDPPGDGELEAMARRAAEGEPDRSLSSLPPSVGWAMMGAGVFLFILPGVPGIPLMVIAAGVLAARISYFGSVDAWVARRFPKFYVKSIVFAERFEGDFSRRFPNPQP